jgi:hypothetical protein
MEDERYHNQSGRLWLVWVFEGGDHILCVAYILTLLGPVG